MKKTEASFEIETDGTPSGTRIFGSNGQPLEGIVGLQCLNRKTYITLEIQDVAYNFLDGFEPDDFTVDLRDENSKRHEVPTSHRSLSYDDDGHPDAVKVESNPFALASRLKTELEASGIKIARQKFDEFYGLGVRYVNAEGVCH